MSEINKHYTFQEYLENFSSIQDSYDYYFELQKEVDRLSENNLAMQEEMARTWDKLQQKENIIKEVREYIEKETKELYSKNKSCKYLGEIMQLEYILEILDKENK